MVSIMADPANTAATWVYHLHAAFEEEDLGRILFDAQGYWIYDGDSLSIAEQEQLARFIQQHREVLWSS
ncbi:MAG: hypothetical protein JWQ66_4646 [Mucilaginibacter sp.]|nr:hypothetical protein [Mucilaginibacter sp.]